jgi:hypothetical protein
MIPKSRYRLSDKIMRQQNTTLTRTVLSNPTAVNLFACKTGGKICLDYPILWELTAALPDIAVNEPIQARSQRFGRVSFQTRSKV